MAGQSKKRCKSGTRKCGTACRKYKGLSAVNKRCSKGTRRCPRKVGRCFSKKARTTRKRRYGRY